MSSRSVAQPTAAVQQAGTAKSNLPGRKLVASGMACILISSELEEVLGLANRVLVMREGSVAGELHGAGLREDEIMYYATGLKHQEQNP